MLASSISKQSASEPGSPLALAIGAELRRRRTATGQTQAAVGYPLTRSFVCAVERGHTMPSIAALALLVQKLGISLAEFFSGVNEQMTGVYTPAHERHPDPASGRRR
jgi:transcriptional regulator with XRE-family HTH domain